MEAEEKNRLTAMEKDLVEIKKEMGELNHKMEEIYTAIVGNQLNPAGLIQRITEMETKVESLNKAVSDLGEGKLKIKIIWAALGLISSAVIAYIVSVILPSLKK